MFVQHKLMHKLFSNTKGNLEGPEYEQNHSTAFSTDEKEFACSSSGIGRSRSKDKEMVMDNGGPHDLKCDPTRVLLNIYVKIQIHEMLA